LIKQKLYKYIVYPLARLYWKIFSPVTNGARALVLFDNEILLVKNLNLPYWTMPGGGIDSGETPEHCVVRELKEELDLNHLTIEYKLGEYNSQKEGKKDTVHVFIIHPESKDFTQQWEIEGAQWFSLNTLPENMSQATLRRINEYKKGDTNLHTSW
jgi:ADP-ribose pyrophosphatase YjhB (NUDIX family)